MGPGDIHQIVAETIWTIMIATAPVLGVAMVVGFGIALFQALTSVQELTLTFVPKIIAIFLTLLLSLAFMFATLTRLSDHVFALVAAGF
jgi:flagellar biosynthetic protein FliQ